MRAKRRATINDLRLAIAALPRATRVAMLEGIRTNDIIAGAYASEQGICPMLAAHRGGGRTSAISFARAWDRFVFRDERPKSARRASDRELLVLSTHLETSLLGEDLPAQALAGAIAEHHALVERAGAGVTPDVTKQLQRVEHHPAHNRRSAPPRRPARRGATRTRTPDSTGAYLLRGGTGAARSGAGTGRTNR